MDRRRLFLQILAVALLFVFLRSIGWPPGKDDGLVQVMYVIDGDTIVVEGGQQVRYIGIDTPEVTPSTECFGDEATVRNRELVEGKRVRLVPDVTDRDRYGRLLRYVYTGETFVNLELVRSGYARALYIVPDIRYYPVFKEAETSAREASLGRWGACQ